MEFIDGDLAGVGDELVPVTADGTAHCGEVVEEDVGDGAREQDRRIRLVSVFLSVMGMGFLLSRESLFDLFTRKASQGYP